MSLIILVENDIINKNNSDSDIRNGQSILNKKNYVGYIQFYEDNDCVSIGHLYVNDKYQGKGFGKLIILLMISYLEIATCNQVTSISLEDHSDRSLDRSSIYYKLGFRITDSTSPEEMRIFLNSKLIPENVNLYNYGNSTGSQVVPKYKNVIDYLKQNLNKTHATTDITWDIFLKDYKILVYQNENSIEFVKNSTENVNKLLSENLIRCTRTLPQRKCKNQNKKAKI